MTVVSPPHEPVPSLDFAPLGRLAASVFPEAGGGFDCVPMAGGASVRRYFRIRAGTKTAVAMYVPDGAQAEEIESQVTSTRWPFLEVRDLLASHGVDVPRLYGEAAEQGWVLLEDLGDDTLAVFLVAHPERREELYVRAVTDVARAQRLLRRIPEGSVVAARSFDEEMLLLEMDHFREWGLEARGVVLSASDRAIFDRASERLARQVAGIPRTFVHRDYQSRNLMVRPTGELCWIDFQDALLGPRIYDIVALLNDSYQVFDAAFVEARLDDYARAAGLDDCGRAAVRREFDWVTVQRKLKDAGRFSYIDRVKGNPAFLRFMEPTVAKARASLARLREDPDMRALSDLLGRVRAV
ncbi:MAG TPA: phosphotransferase, partial [Polyangiaceae bacterium]|nr:phosphotransferase [Polyangiaceae bacterium]